MNYHLYSHHLDSLDYEHPQVFVSEDEHKLLQASRHVYSTTTNTEMKQLSGIKLKAADIGLLLSGLRKLKLIDYQHIETDRQAAGSGRYQLTPTFVLLSSPE